MSVINRILNWIPSKFTSNSTPSSKKTTHNCHPSRETSELQHELCQIQQYNSLTQWHQSNESQFEPPLQTMNHQIHLKNSTPSPKKSPKKPIFYVKSQPNFAKFKDPTPPPSTRPQHFKKQIDTKFTSNWSPWPQKSPTVAIFHIRPQQFTHTHTLSQIQPFNPFPWCQLSTRAQSHPNFKHKFIKIT